MAADMHVLVKSTVDFPLNPADYAAQPVPSLNEFKQLWSAWDLVTQHMIPKEELLSKPIKLRNCCIFYLGHIPTFLDIHLTKATRQAPTEPSYYHRIFERGIDPDVDDPELCHAHSEIPNEWPPVKQILEYQSSVRSRVEALFEWDGELLSPAIERALWLGFEHEGMSSTLHLYYSFYLIWAHWKNIAMHLETLLYMLLQSERTLPPPGPIPDFRALAQAARENTIPNEWITIPATTIVIGMDDPDTDLEPGRYFGWDNEKPRREIQVPSFEAKARPLTIEDYARYLYESGLQTVPASWSQADGLYQASSKSVKHSANGVHFNSHSQTLDRAFLSDKFVRTVYGLVALEHALTWPVIASYDELAKCARWMNGRIPTANEARSIYNHVDLAKKEEAEKVLARTISAVNGYVPVSFSLGL